MNRSGLLLLIGAIIVAVLTTWFNSRWLNFKDFQFTQKEKKIDFYLSDFTLLNVHADGRMRYLVKGKHLIHQQSSKTSELFKPVLKARSSNGDITTLVAEKAKQESNNGLIHLQGNVTVMKNTDKPSESIQLKTSDLIYNPVEKTLESEKKVIMISNFGNLQGVGFRSKLDQQEIRILSNVQAEFLPAN